MKPTRETQPTVPDKRQPAKDKAKTQRRVDTRFAFERREIASIRLDLRKSGIM